MFILICIRFSVWFIIKFFLYLRNWVVNGIGLLLFNGIRIVNELFCDFGFVLMIIGVFVFLILGRLIVVCVDDWLLIVFLEWLFVWYDGFIEFVFLCVDVCSKVNLVNVNFISKVIVIVLLFLLVLLFGILFCDFFFCFCGVGIEVLLGLGSGGVGVGIGVCGVGDVVYKLGILIVFIVWCIVFYFVEFFLCCNLVIWVKL